MKDKPLVSVVVPTFNSEGFLEECLRSVRGQTYPCIEVIVVDNYSTDRTREITEKYGVRVVLCRGIRSRARNVGAGLAKGEFIFSVDSDMELTPNVVGECVAKVESGFDAVIIPEVSVGEGFWAKCRALEKLCYIGDDLIEAARFFRKEVFKAVRGYDAALEAGEDWDIHLRVKDASYSIGRVNAFIRHLEGKLSLRDAVLKKYRYGKTLELYVRKHPEKARAQLKILRPAFLRNWKILMKNPMYSLGMLFMKTCEFISSESGYSVT